MTEQLQILYFGHFKGYYSTFCGNESDQNTKQFESLFPRQFQCINVLDNYFIKIIEIDIAIVLIAKIKTISYSEMF